MYPKPYIDYLVFFHSFRDYFECHEVLEEYWKEKNKEEIVWVGFIQLAVSMYHYRRNNYVGALKLLKSAINIFNSENTSDYGLDHQKFLKLLKQKQNDITFQHPYEPIQLPIIDEGLLRECRVHSLEQGKEWGKHNSCHDPFIIHKHSLRDRHSVILEREQSLKKKNKDRK